MSVFRGSLALTRGLLTETRRAPVALFWNLAFPLLILVGLLMIFGGDQAAQKQRVLGGVLTINLIAAAFFGISLHMVSLREAGLYRRYRATPISSLSVVAAHSITAAVTVFGSLILQLAVARVVFGIPIEGSIPTLAAVHSGSLCLHTPGPDRRQHRSRHAHRTGAQQSAVLSHGVPVRGGNSAFGDA